jgi:hypothetical protein
MSLLWIAIAARSFVAEGPAPEQSWPRRISFDGVWKDGALVLDIESENGKRLKSR